MFPCLNPGTLGVGLPFERLVEVAAKAGFKGVEFGVHSLCEAEGRLGAAGLAALLEKTQVSPVSFGLPVDTRAPGAFADGLASLPRLATTAARYGCRIASTWLEPGTDDPPVEKVLAQIPRLAACARILGDFGIGLALELVGPHAAKGKAHRYIDSMETIRGIVSSVGEPNVGILLDSIHWYTASGEADSITSLRPGSIFLVHIDDVPPGPATDCKDGVRLLPGEGVIDLGLFITSLKKAGYAGAVSVESMNRERPPVDAFEFAIKAYDSFVALLS